MKLTKYEKFEMTFPKKMETPREANRSKGILKEVSDSYGA